MEVEKLVVSPTSNDIEYDISINNDFTYEIEEADTYSFELENVQIIDITEDMKKELVVIPTKEQQVISSGSEIVYNKVIVEPIPKQYADVSDTTATPQDVVIGKVFYNADGEKSEGLLGDTYHVIVIDYNATILKQAELPTGAIFTLPNPPIRKGMIFDCWSSPVEIVNNTVTVEDSDIIIGAIWKTESGLSEFDIILNTNTGLSVTLNFDGTKNWGDGTIDTETTHTYTDYGNYTITCDGVAKNISTPAFGQASNKNNKYVKEIRLGSNIGNVNSLFQRCDILEAISFSVNCGGFNTTVAYCKTLKALIIPSNVTNIGNNTAGENFSLKYAVLPLGLTYMSNSFQYCYSLERLSIPNTVTYINLGLYLYNLKSLTLPNSVATFGGLHQATSLQSLKLPDTLQYLTSNFNGYPLKTLIIPNSVTSIPSQLCYNSYAIETLKIPDNINLIPEGMCSSCRVLKNVNIPKICTSIARNAFYSCYSLEHIELPDTITSIGQNAFSACYSLTKIKIPSALTIIEPQVFSNCYSITEYDFTTLTSIPTLSNTNAFTNINTGCKMYVPDDLYDEWIVATNWATYADYIYKASEKPAE